MDFSLAIWSTFGVLPMSYDEEMAKINGMDYTLDGVHGKIFTQKQGRWIIEHHPNEGNIVTEIEDGEEDMDVFLDIVAVAIEKGLVSI